jgi:hypothetical protein
MRFSRLNCLKKRMNTAYLHFDVLAKTLRDCVHGNAPHLALKSASCGTQ